MTADDPIDALMRMAFCGHAWLIDRLVRPLSAAGDPVQDRLFSARDHAEDCARMAAGRMGEFDPFLLGPAPPVPDLAGWFDLGFSALLLELLTLHVQPPHPVGPDENTAYGAVSESFRDLRRFALKLAAAEGEEAVTKRTLAFVIPAVEAFGPEFLRGAVETLNGRIPRRQILKEAVAALEECGLPGEAWLYIEPQLDRYAKLFGIGFIKKKTIKAGLWLAK